MFRVNKLFRWLSIKSKLIIAFAGLSVLPIIILSVYGIISTSNRMNHSAIQNLDHDLTLIQENTANLFTDIEQDLQVIQSSFLTPQLRTALNSNGHLNENLLNNVLDDLELIQDLSDEEAINLLREEVEELEKLFDYDYYLRYVDDIFERLGLTEVQFQEVISKFESEELAPKSI